MTKNSINLALSPIENDLLTMNIKEGGEANYNIHELPNNDGKSFNILFYSTTYSIYLALVLVAHYLGLVSGSWIFEKTRRKRVKRLHSGTTSDRET